MKEIRLKYVASIIAGQSPSGDAVLDEGSMPFLQGCAEFGLKHPQPDRYCDAPSRIAPKGAFLFSVRAPVGKMNVADQEYGIGRGLAAIIPNSINQRFLSYAIQHSAPSLSEVSTGSTYEAVSSSDIGNMAIPCPEISQQEKIADFLDCEIARIDRLIEKKRDLVNTLADHVQAMIDEAVLGAQRSANEAAPRLRHLVSFAPRPRAGVVETLPVSFLPMEAIEDGVGGLKEHGTKAFGDLSSGSYNYCADGDILLAKVTPCFENGKKAVVRKLESGIGFATSEVHVVRPDPDKIDASYLCHLLSSSEFRDSAMASMTGAGGLKRVSESSIANTRVPVIDLGEQRKIAEDLDAKISSVDEVRKKTLESIELLREYRSTLITAAVTGQIDVAAWKGNQAPTNSAPISREDAA